MESPPTPARLRGINYTREEVAALRRLWPRATVEEIERALPGRGGIKAIRAKAHALGLVCEVYRGGGLRFERARQSDVYDPKTAAYTNAELTILRELWPRGTTEQIQQALPNRTLNSIRFKAHQLRLQCLVGRGQFSETTFRNDEDYGRANRKESQRLGVSVTAEELRRLPYAHPGRLAFTIAGYISGSAAQEAWRRWQHEEAKHPGHSSGRGV